MAEMARQDAIANNLANLSTPGYKADQVTQREFASVLLANRSTGQVVGTASAGVLADSTTAFGKQGALKRTDNPLDVALDGSGYLAVQSEDGVRYTRNGRLTVGAGGQLVDGLGNRVLGTDGRPITLPAGGDRAKMLIDDRGVITAGGRRIGQLRVVDLADARKVGGSLVEGTPAAGQSATTKVSQGAIETSNVDAAQTMVDMIASMRTFETSQRVLRTIDESLSRAAQLASINH